MDMVHSPCAALTQHTPCSSLHAAARIKQIRKKLGHNKKDRARAKRRPPAEPLLSIVWEGHDGTAEEEAEWVEEDEEPTEDISKLTVPELKERLKTLNVAGYSGKKKEDLVTMLREELNIVDAEATRAAEVEDADGDDGEAEEDEDDAETMTSEQKEILEELKKVRVRTRK
jgi:hypothetical protein